MNKEIKITEDKPKGPSIPLGFVRDPKTGRINKIRIAPFTPGMIIERAGKRYQIDAKGTQRRIK